jgi:hypothetical protein
MQSTIWIPYFPQIDISQTDLNLAFTMLEYQTCLDELQKKTLRIKREPNTQKSKLTMREKLSEICNHVFKNHFN